MNQILDYNPNGNNGKKTSGSDNIVRVFAVIMIIFAICLAGSGIYGIYKKNKATPSTSANEEKAKIEVTQEESQAIIKVTHTKAIEKIIYSWNTGRETSIKTSGESNVEEVIALPAGENTLHVKVTDVDGKESTYEGEFTSESGEDIISPVIELKVTEEKKLRISVTDETSLDFITYRWNDDEEQRVETSEEDKTKIEVDIDILKGVNDITIVAVDSNNNTTTETKSYTGLTKPEVTITVAADKKSVEIAVKHENGLKEVRLKVNDVDYNVDIGEENPKEITFPVDLPEGDSKITVTAVSIDSTETVATEEVSNNTITSSQEEPIISIEKATDGQTATIIAKDQSGIKEVKLNINDVDYNVDIGEENPKEIEFPVSLVDGNNKITFTVIPVEGNEKQEVKEISK